MSANLGGANGVARNLWPPWEAFSLSNFFQSYTDNLVWSMFLTSTGNLFIFKYFSLCAQK